MNLRNSSTEFDTGTREHGSAPSSADAAWFAAQIKPNSDAIAQRNLVRQGFSVFLPRLKKTERRHAQFRESRRPMFPGYIFVHVDTACGHWRAINSTLGITRLVSLGGRPSPVPAGFVEALQQRCDADGLFRPMAELAPGDMARIVEGPFADFVVRVDAMDDNQRLWVLFDLMGRQSRLAVPRKNLTPI